MKTNNSVFLLLFPLLLANQALGLSSSAIGMMVVSKGQIAVVNNAGESEKGKVGLEVFEGDRIKSEASSTAKIVTTDRNVLVVGENSEVLIEKYSNTDPLKKQVIIKLNQGSIRSALQQTYAEQDERFEVISPIAVAGVRGTDFLTEYHPQTKESVVCTFKGQVAYQAQENGKPMGPPSLVKSGNFISHSFGLPPQMTQAKPAWIEKRLSAHEVKGNAMEIEQQQKIKPQEREHRQRPNDSRDQSPTGGGPREQKGGRQSGPGTDSKAPGPGSRDSGQGPKSRAPGEGLRQGMKQGPEKGSSQNGPNRSKPMGPPGGGPTQGPPMQQNGPSPMGPGQQQPGPAPMTSPRM